MPKLFIKAKIDNSVIYIKADSTIVYSDTRKCLDVSLIDVLHDFGYTLTISTPETWDYHIEYGNSYEIDTEEEVLEFEENNIKIKEIKHETQS